MARHALRPSDLCEYKPYPGLQVRWRPARLLVLDHHHAEVQPLRRGKPDGSPVRVKLQQVRAQKVSQAIVRVQAARRARSGSAGDRPGIGGRSLPSLAAVSAADTAPGAPRSASEHMAPERSAPATGACQENVGATTLAGPGAPAPAAPGQLRPSSDVRGNQGLRPVAPLAERRYAPIPKPARPVRSRRYLAFVRSHPCCSCGALAPSEAHHWGPRAVGEKTDDLRTVPLCRRCHDAWHGPAGTLPGRDRATSERLMLAVQVGLLVRYFADSGIGGP
jgi:hypothetical protein